MLRPSRERRDIVVGRGPYPCWDILGSLQTEDERVSCVAASLNFRWLDVRGENRVTDFAAGVENNVF